MTEPQCQCENSSPDSVTITVGGSTFIAYRTAKGLYALNHPQAGPMEFDYQSIMSGGDTFALSAGLLKIVNESEMK